MIKFLSILFIAILFLPLTFTYVSLYYTAGTTFINLKTKCRPFTFIIKHKGESYDSIPKIIIENVSGKSKKKHNYYSIPDTSIGSFAVFKNQIVSTSPLRSSDGHYHFKGWMTPKDIDQYNIKPDDINTVDNILNQVLGLPNERESISVGIKINNFPKNAKISKLLTSIIYNILNPKNRKDMKEEYYVDLKNENLGYSKTFLKKLVDKNYTPNLNQLFDDYLIYQTAEILFNNDNNKDDYWKKDKKIVKSLIIKALSKEENVSKLKKVFSERPIEISGILFSLFSKDPLTKQLLSIENLFDFSLSYQETKKIDIIDCVYFREFSKTNFTSAVNNAIGIVKATETYGKFDHDELLSKVSYLEKIVFEDIRNHIKKRNVLEIQQYKSSFKPTKSIEEDKDNENDKDEDEDEEKPENTKTTTKSKIKSNEKIEPYIFKYVTIDKRCKNVNNSETKELTSVYKEAGTRLYFLSTGYYGSIPLIIPTESVVYHQRTEHRFNIRGTYNPALINVNILHALEQKWLEYKFWEEYSPGAISKTVLLSEIIPKNTTYPVSPELFVKVANEQFPMGWVAKGAWDYNSVKKIITNKLDIVKIVNDYKKSDFDDLVSRSLKNLRYCEPVEDLNDIVKFHPNYQGWKINMLLEKPDEAIIQQMVQIFEEQRVEGQAGVCYLDLQDSDKYSNRQPNHLQNKIKMSIHDFSQNAINSLPIKLRGIPITADVCYDRTHKVRIIETNPGGNSWILCNFEPKFKKHLQFLKNYPKIVEMDRKLGLGDVHDGLTPEQQMSYLSSMMKKWNINMEKSCERFTLMKDRLFNNEVFLKENIDKMIEKGDFSHFTKRRN